MTIRSTILTALAIWAVVDASPVSAADWSVVLNGKAFHVDASRDWNESNWGLGFEREFYSGGRWVKVALGNGFVDSQNEMSYMAGGGIMRRFRLAGISPDAYVDVGAIGFVMTRQDVNDNRPFPGVLPAVTLGTRRFALNLTYIPGTAANRTASVKRYDHSIDGIVFLQLKLDATLFAPSARHSMRLAAAER